MGKFVTPELSRKRGIGNSALFANPQLKIGPAEAGPNEA
jgi:hypothetical protein